MTRKLNYLYLLHYTLFKIFIQLVNQFFVHHFKVSKGIHKFFSIQQLKKLLYTTFYSYGYSFLMSR
jgi:hypothetical protein